MLVLNWRVSEQDQKYKLQDWNFSGNIRMAWAKIIKKVVKQDKSRQKMLPKWRVSEQDQNFKLQDWNLNENIGRSSD